MANGVLGKAMSNSAALVNPYTVPPTANFATVSINLTNTGTEDAKVKLAITTSASPGVVDYIEYDAVIPANGGSLERTYMLMSANEKLTVECDKSTVACRVYGLEDLPA